MKEQFNEIIISKDLRNISLDLVEKVLDNEITSKVLKEFPLLKLIVAVKNIYSSYTDRIFIKKAMNVLLELGETNWKERVELTSELDDENGTGSEKILLAIDRLETIKKCKVYGKLCRLKALKKIDKEDFLRLTKLVQDAYLDDLVLITDFEKGKEMEIYEGDYYPLISLGLIFQVPSEQEEIRIEQGHDYRDTIKGGQIIFNYLLSDIGEVLLDNYYDLFPN